MHIHLYKIGIGLAIILFSCGADCKKVAHSQARQFAPHDISLTGSAAENPYATHRLWADFTGPEDKSLQAEGFWNGGTQWIIRVALPEAGLWNYVTHSNDPLLDNQTDTIQCLEASGRGFVKQSGRHFFYDDGTPFFRIGDTCWRLYRSKNVPFETHFKPYIDARAEQGFNYIVGVIHTVGDPSINEGGSLWEDDTNLQRLRPEYFEWVDKRVQYMNEKGIIPGIMLVWSGTFKDFYRPPYDRDTFSRFRRYVIARYAAFNVFWIISGEYAEEMQPADYDYHGTHIKMGNDDPLDGLLDVGDPYNHPISIHPSGSESNGSHYDLFSDWLSYIMQQRSGSPQLLYTHVYGDRYYGLPVCNDEFGYVGPTDADDPYYDANNQSARRARKDAWAMVCAGAYVTWGHISTYTGREYILDPDSLYTRGAHYMSILSKFMQSGVNYWTMGPYPSIVTNGTAFCLAKKGKEYLFYLPDGGALEFNLDAYNYEFDALWLNPVTGDTMSAGTLSGRFPQTVTAPFSDDALLYVHNPHDIPIGIDLISFDAVRVENSLHLTWETGHESDIAGFIIDRSDEPVVYKELSSFRTNPDLLAQGSPALGHTYSYIDSTVEVGRSYSYKLSGMSLHGLRSEYGVIEIEIK
ncbi:DUF4038 domain-containing protein [candidate division KSB1 bacterium]|nr:DUF4038 domain-containing protein [candidate division KSB1 bacterium]